MSRPTADWMHEGQRRREVCRQRTRRWRDAERLPYGARPYVDVGCLRAGALCALQRCHEYPVGKRIPSCHADAPWTACLCGTCAGVQPASSVPGIRLFPTRIHERQVMERVIRADELCALVAGGDRLEVALARPPRPIPRVCPKP